MTAWKDDPELTARLQDEVELLQLRREAKRVVDAKGRPPVQAPEVLTLKERLARPPDPIAWRVEGWIPAGGRIVLAAPAKAGKTTLVTNLVRSLVDGAPWLGRDPVTTTAGKVAIFDFEMSERQLDAWYRRIGIAADDRVLLLALRGKAAAFDLRDEACRAEWAAILLEHQVDFVVWDCLRPVMDALGLDENHDAGYLLTGFDALLAESGHPDALVVQHMGHTSERARGDSRIVGWGEGNWKLLLGPEGGEAGPRWLSAYGRDVEQGETQLSRDAETGRLLVASGGVSRAAARTNAAVDAVLAVLQATGEPMKAGDIETAVTALGVPRALAREALGQLVALRHIDVQQGEKNAKLHSLNAAVEAVSSPVRQVSPPFAGEEASLSAAAYSGGLANTTGGVVRHGELKPLDLSAGPTAEQQALLDRLMANTAANPEPGAGADKEPGAGQAADVSAGLMSPPVPAPNP